MRKPLNFDALATAAAKWWRNILDQRPPQETGDKALNHQVNSLLAFAKASGPALTEEQLAQFESQLLELIQKRIDYLQEHGGTRDHWQIAMCVDYGPEGILRDATQGLPMDFTMFPFKTRSYIDPNGFSVSQGYGAQEKLILAATYE